MIGNPVVYCAGPYVFLEPEEREREERKLKGLLKALDLDPRFPLAEGRECRPSVIRSSNLEIIESCDGVLADLRPFRGPEPDAGTVYECAWAAAHGKRVAGFSTHLEYRKLVPHHKDADGVRRDNNGYAVEDFGLPVNLMLAEHVYGSRGEAINWLDDVLNNRVYPIPPITAQATHR